MGDDAPFHEGRLDATSSAVSRSLAKYCWNEPRLPVQIPLDPEALAAGLATLGFADVPAFAQWVASASEIEIDGAIAFLHHYAGQ